MHDQETRTISRRFEWKVRDHRSADKSQAPTPTDEETRKSPISLTHWTDLYKFRLETRRPIVESKNLLIRR